MPSTTVGKEVSGEPDVNGWYKAINETLSAAGFRMDRLMVVAVPRFVVTVK